MKIPHPRSRNSGKFLRGGDRIKEEGIGGKNFKEEGTEVDNAEQRGKVHLIFNPLGNRKSKNVSMIFFHLLLFMDVECNLKVGISHFVTR